LAEQLNIITASFCPFLIKSCVSMRSINDFGPCPSKTGRYIGSPVAVADGAGLPCDQARLTIDSKVIRENVRARMGKYASGARQFFKGECCEDSRGDRWAASRRPAGGQAPGMRGRNLSTPKPKCSTPLYQIFRYVL